MKYREKMVLGYLIGGMIVLILVPSLIYFATTLTDTIFKIEIIQRRQLRWGIAAVLAIAGFIFGSSSIIYQNIVGKGGPLEISKIEISPKTKFLVTTGPYRYTRNPMLFGTLLTYSALGVLMNSLTAIFLVVLMTVVMLLVEVKTEEKRLLKDFGDQYRKYRKETSCLIPWLPKKD